MFARLRNEYVHCAATAIFIFVEHHRWLADEIAGRLCWAFCL